MINRQESKDTVDKEFNDCKMNVSHLKTSVGNVTSTKGINYNEHFFIQNVTDLVTEFIYKNSQVTKKDLRYYCEKIKLLFVKIGTFCP